MCFFFTLAEISPKAGVECYECFWKRGNAQSPYDPKCGYDSNNFKPDNTTVKKNCGICELTVNYDGGKF